MVCRTADIAMRFRHWLLALAVLFTAGGAFYLIAAPKLLDQASIIGTPLNGQDPDHEWAFYANASVVVGAVLLLQWLFLRPRRGWHVQLAEHGRPYHSAAIAAAGIAMLVTAGAITVVLECVNVWPAMLEKLEHPYLIWAVMAAIWLAWTVLFFVYWRDGDRYTQLSRMLRGLLAGSILETLAATAVFAINPRKQDCYCARGSYTGLVFGVIAIVWCFGPGVALLYMRQRRHLADAGFCLNCGYNLRGSESATCPECGAKKTHGS